MTPAIGENAEANEISAGVTRLIPENQQSLTADHNDAPIQRHPTPEDGSEKIHKVSRSEHNEDDNKKNN